MASIRLTVILSLAVVLLLKSTQTADGAAKKKSNPAAPVPPACTPGDFHYVYSECDENQDRWRVAVPSTDCQGGTVPVPSKAPKCGKTCEPGEYLDIQETQDCLPCEEGTYSLGGGERFDTWDTLPVGFDVDVEVNAWWDEEDANCSGSVWKAVGPFVTSPGDYCYSKLIYSAELKKPGFVNFTYSLPTKDTLLHVQVRNEQCEDIDFRSRSDKFPMATGENQWATVEIELEAGHNIITWKAFGLSSYQEESPAPVYIREIIVMGLDYTSKCTPCPAGTHAPNTGSSRCIACPLNSRSDEGSATCIECESSQYAYVGSDTCTEKVPCKEQDYYKRYDYSKCQMGKKTQVEYKWIEPVICEYGIAGAVPRPSSTEEDCPSCNPGMQLSKDGHCEFCKDGQFSDGKDPCKACPALTIPKKMMKYLTWKELPPYMTTSCLNNDEDSNCDRDSGWIAAGNHIHSGENYADDVYLILTLDVTEFQVGGSYFEGQDTVVAEITFAFDMDCHQDCSLYFLEELETSSPQFLATWTGKTNQTTIFTHKISTTTPRTFTWAFEKKDPKTVLDPSVDLRHDVAKIYNITVTNVKNGGASYCEACPEGRNKECISCSAGMYYSNDTKTCKPCALNHYLSPSNDHCIPCGPGLKNVQQKVCYSDCSFSLDKVDYNLSALKGFHTLDTSSSFTEAGNRFFKRYNISLCGTEGSLDTKCRASKMSSMDETELEISSLICRTTILPSSKENEISTQVMSIGDVLLGITHENKLGSLKVNMTKPRTDGLNVKDIKFFYRSAHTTSGCKEGRSTIITLRCDPNAKGNGTIEFIPECRDGTCDGCNFLILWTTESACPSCGKNDYTEIKGECKDETQKLHYVWREHKICVGGSSLPKNKEQACEMPKWYRQMPWYAQWSIAGMVTMAILMAVLIMFFWKRNRKLEYKYEKLIASANGELPAAETCALSEGEEEDDVVFQDRKGKGKKFFNKFIFKNGSGEKELLNASGHMSMQEGF
ncbi:endosome/lysosome-associated apoptosis and autophagy regulator 1-like isoform X2 [Apostichopus japonicus]|uniref:endosome/lysosome-associated apoptosis and autophagy regulator 1-like isoform X2 n=1 Tax=Stichopus japonicus TaxID=307972 RepID=UPI003AB7BC4E